MSAEGTADVQNTLAGGGEMGRRMRAYDWSATSLGPASGWPQSLKTAVRIMLGSRYPMFIWWGPERINLYNDGYGPMLGNRHPAALGKPASLVWSEIWDTVGAQADTVFSEGRATWNEERLLILERNGYPEETYFTFSYSPIPGDGGGVGGLFCALTEDTQRVLGRRRLRTLRELSAGTTGARTVADACKAVADTLAQNPHDLPFAVVYLLDAEGEVATLAATTGLPEGSPAGLPTLQLTSPDGGPAAWPLARVRDTGRAELVERLEARCGPLRCGAWPESPQAALVLPLQQSGQDRLAGFLVAGVSPRRTFDDDYRGFLEMLAGHVATAIANARAYEEERRRAEALAELDRAKTAFFSNVSHEFRTPLTLMLGPVEDALSEGAALPPAQRERLELAHRNALRLQKLVNTLLDFSRIEAGRVQARYEPVDLAALTADLASNFRSACEKAGLRLVVDCPPLSEPVFVDRDMWEKVVLNLLSNAFKYTLEGEIVVSLRQEGPRAVLAVRDTGTGIPAEEMPLLFERFYRVAGSRGRTQEGTGIGLALVRELVRLHGGEVGAESEPGRGSTFTVTVPLGKSHLPADRIGTAAAPTPTALGAAPFVEEALRWLPTGVRGQGSGVRGQESGVRGQGSGVRGQESGNEEDQAISCSSLTPDSCLLTPDSRPRVLVADDNADMRDYIARLLAGRYEVIAVGDGRRALDAARENPPDLVLADVMMPELDGFGLLHVLRAEPRTATVPVLLLSARAGEEARVEGLQAGADDYLTKPFGARELLARVGAHLEMAKLRRQAEEERRRGDLQVRSILESITDAFFALDRSWSFTYVNREAERLLGRGRGDLVGKRLWDEYADTLGTDFERNYRRAMDENAAVSFEAYYPPHERWYEVHAYPSPSGLAVYFRDANERRAAREALRESEAKYRAVVESNMVGTGFWRADGTITEANDTLLKMLGYTRAEVAAGAVRFTDITPPEHRAADERALAEIAEVGYCTPFEKEYVRKDGTRVPVVLGAARLPHDPTRGPFFALDVGDRKRAEAALREASATLRSFYDTAPVMMGVVEVLDGDILHLTDNAATGQFFGVNPDALAGRRASELRVPADHLREWLNCYRESERTGWPVRFEYPHETPSGVRWVSAIVFCMERLAGGRIRCSYVAEDVTERKRAEEALREADRRKDEFLATLAHELRNPLAPLRNSLQILRMPRLDADSAERARGMMERQVQHLVRLVDDLLDVSRVMRGKITLHPERVEVATVVARAAETVQPLIDAQGHDFTVSLPDESLPLDADPVRLAQVVGNLLANAAKYTEPKGRITLSARREGDAAVLSVRDTGIGIAPELLPKVFDLFVQADHAASRSQGGLGIGLTLVKNLVEMHGGSVEAHSAGIGKGSEFVVRLPLAAPADEAAGREDGGESGPARSGPRLRLLVVDDSRDAADSLGMLLRLLGHEVRVVHDGPSALALAPGFRPELIILDIGMPGMDGYEVAKRLRQTPGLNGVRLAALTGWGQPEDRRRTAETGFDHHLVKPVDPDDLEALLASVAARKGD